MAPRRQWRNGSSMAMAQWRDGSLTARDSASASVMDQEHNGDGRRDGE
jgi:hypothetical protein